MKVLLALALLTAAAHADDGGGRDVTVAVFSTRAVHAVTITPVGSHVWIAKCATCKHEPMTAPWKSTTAPEVWVGGSARVRDEGSQTDRTAAGLWHIKRVGTEFDVVLTLPSERFVSMAVAGETDAKEPIESLRAMSIVARTFALNGAHFHARPGHLAAELCDSTQCMAMRWGGVPARVDDAVRATAGETLWSNSKRAEVYFSGSCGGQTEDAGAVWPSLRGASYLKSHPDPYCLRRDGGAKWHADIPLAELASIANAEGWKLPAHILSVRIAERTASGRAARLVFSGEGENDSITASALRFGIGRALGFGKVRSDWYDATVRGASLVLDGKGHGHGVGLCQTGAMQMASEGKRSAEILGFYFPGAIIGITPHGDVWSETTFGPLHIRSVGKSPDVLAAWNQAQGRFPGAKLNAANITFAPTVELFRQLSSQPGWMLASTRGSDIILQPASIVGNAMQRTLLHELLHLLVESEATPSTPLWLREGLVEALAGEKGRGAMPTAELEAALANPPSREASERAHLAAAAKVQALINTHSLTTVRIWLRNGVPVGL